MLRSDTVIAAYRSLYQGFLDHNNPCPHHTLPRPTSDWFFEAYGGHYFYGSDWSEGWDALNGSHHIFLVQNTSPWHDQRRGFTDVVELVERERTKTDDVLKECQRQRDRYLLLKVDLAHPPQALLKKLGAIFKARHKTALDSIIQEVVCVSNVLPYYTPTNPRQKPFVNGYDGVVTWLNYLKCYDMRKCEGLTYGSIAEKIYGSKSKRDIAEKAVRRVEQIIAAAESQKWPPELIK